MPLRLDTLCDHCCCAHRGLTQQGGTEHTRILTSQRYGMPSLQHAEIILSPHGKRQEIWLELCSAGRGRPIQAHTTLGVQEDKRVRVRRALPQRGGVCRCAPPTRKLSCGTPQEIDSPARAPFALSHSPLSYPRCPSRCSLHSGGHRKSYPVRQSRGPMEFLQQVEREARGGGGDGAASATATATAEAGASSAAGLW